MRQKLRVGGLGLLLLAVASSAAAQGERVLRIGIGGMASAYLGDYSDRTTQWTRFYPGLMASVGMDQDRLLSWQGKVGIGRFADQYDLRHPNLPTGVTPIDFVTTDFVVGELRLRMQPIRKGPLRPYVSAGAGFMSFSPRDARGRFLADAPLTRLPDESYATFTLQAPLSVGMDFRISPLFAIGAEYALRFTATDYLDNQSALGSRPGNDRLHGPVIWATFFLRGQQPLPTLEPNPETPPPGPLPAQIWSPEWSIP